MNKKLLFAAFASAFSLLVSSCGEKAVLTKSGLDPENFKSEYEGQPTALYTMTNKNGMEVCITNYGGRIVSIMVPDRNGEFKDVVLGFDKVSDYFPENHQTDFGAAIGRYANRINKGQITVDGKEYQLPQNNFGHCLHGGPQGWQYKVYKTVEADGNHLKLEMDSPDGDMNFPGNVTAYVTYTLTDDNAIDIRYEATTDAPTIINMTNHSYFNLSGDPGNHPVTEQIMYINSSNITPIDETSMTSGEFRPVEGTAFDFRTAKEIGRDINDTTDVQIVNGKGYDHNWVLDTNRDDTVLALELYSPLSGIVMKEYTDEPGIQAYTGNYLDGTLTGKGGVVYGYRSGLALESQKYPDSPNKPDWPSPYLNPGETYTSHCVFAFSTK